MINISELLGAVKRIANGDDEFVLISNSELTEMCKQYHEKEKRNTKQEIIKESPERQSPVETPTSSEYKNIKRGEVDPNDMVGDIEMSNKPVYYVPVGDGLYRPTLDRRIFLFHACLALYKANLSTAAYGEQYKYLTDIGFESYDICLAAKLKEGDAIRMLGKENSDVPYYVRTKWSLCFDPERIWHPIHIKKARAEKIVEQKNAEHEKETLKRIFRKEDNEKPQDTEEPKTLIGSKYYLKTIISSGETPINFSDYPKFLNVCVREEGARGCGTAYPNLDVISKWLKEDTIATKDFPHKDLKSFTSWCKEYQISAKQFLAMFDRQYNAQLAFTNDLVNAINTRLGVEFLMATAKRNPRKKNEDVNIAKPMEEEHVAKIKRVLWNEHKYSIQTLRKLFTILEGVATRQQIIDLFNIQDAELNCPTDLDKNTAIEINKFCNKSVAIGNR